MLLWLPKSSRPAPLLLMLTTAAELLVVPGALGLSPEKDEELVLPTLALAAKGQTTRLSLDAFGLQLLLELKPDHGFLAPGFRVHTIGHRSGPEVLYIASPADLEHCFYSGTVNGDPESTSALSLCQGVNGAFQVQDTLFFIQPAPGNNTEPLLPSATEEVQSQQLQFHVLRKKPLVGGGGLMCEVGDDETQPTRALEPEAKDTGDHGSQHNGKPGLTGQPAGNGSFRMNYFVSRPRYVETMLVADKSMVDFHGSGLEHYLLTLFSVAFRLFKHPSIHHFISLVVVKILIIEEKDNGPEVSTDAELSLKNFCNWQKQHNSPSDQDAKHYDTAILFTRENICGSQSCDTLGIADFGTMCDPSRSCSVIEDNGFQAALTTAHELGHMFNMPHDHSQQCDRVSRVKADSHVMSPHTTDLDLSPTWSPCSAFMISSFLNKGRGKCLLDKPHSPIKLPSSLPGTLYDFNQQCRFLFGNEYKSCHVIGTCKTLWCTASTGMMLVCEHAEVLWADGTSCGDGKWCISGNCVDKSDREHSGTPLHGRWGRWGPWTGCTKTCGKGRQARMRKCDNPVPKFAGNYCVGHRVQYRFCNKKPCPNKNSYPSLITTRSDASLQTTVP